PTGTLPASAGSSARTARTGTPPGRAARTCPCRRGPGGPLLIVIVEVLGAAQRPGAAPEPVGPGLRPPRGRTHRAASGTVLICPPPARRSSARLRHDAHLRASGTTLICAPPARRSTGLLRTRRVVGVWPLCGGGRFPGRPRLSFHGRGRRAGL